MTNWRSKLSLPLVYFRYNIFVILFAELSRFRTLNLTLSRHKKFHFNNYLQYSFYLHWRFSSLYRTNGTRVMNYSCVTFWQQCMFCPVQRELLQYKSKSASLKNKKVSWSPPKYPKRCLFMLLRGGEPKTSGISEEISL